MMEEEIKQNLKEKYNKKINIAIKVINFIFLVAWMGLVFYFSSEIGNESSSTSGNTIRKIITFFNDEIKLEDLNYIVETYQPIVRKIAHFTLYTTGGVIIYNFINKFKINRSKKIIFSLLIGVLYAITDELHQYFVPGRSSKILDVIIDSSGIITGILLFIIFIKIISIIQNKLFVKFNN